MAEEYSLRKTSAHRASRARIQLHVSPQTALRGGMPHRDLSRSLGTLDTLIEMLQVYVLSSFG